MKTSNYICRNFLMNVYSFASCCDTENTYLANACDDTIFVVDNRSKKIIANIELSDQNLSFSTSELHVTEDKIIAVPYYSNRISVIEKNSCKVTNMEIERGERPVAFYACKVKNELWLLPQMTCSNMYVLNLNNLLLRTHESVFMQNILEEKYSSEFGHTVFSKPLYIEGSIWFIVRKDNKLIEYVIKDRKWEIYIVPFGIINVTCDGKELWLLSDKLELYTWRKSTGVTKELDIRRELNCSVEKRIDFEAMFYEDGCIYCLPYTSDTLCIYDINEKKVKSILIDNKEGGRICDYYICSDGCLYIGSAWHDKMIEIDLALSQVNGREWNIPAEIYERIMERNRIIDEDKLPLVLFLDTLKKRDNLNDHADEVGNVVYLKIKG